MKLATNNFVNNFKVLTDLFGRWENHNKAAHFKAQENTLVVCLFSKREVGVFLQE